MLSENESQKNGQTCPVPHCELLVPHVPYITGFCHACGGGPMTQRKNGVLCASCNLFWSDVWTRPVIGIATSAGVDG